MITFFLVLFTAFPLSSFGESHGPTEAVPVTPPDSIDLFLKSKEWPKALQAFDSALKDILDQRRTGGLSEEEEREIREKGRDALQALIKVVLDETLENEGPGALPKKIDRLRELLDARYKNAFLTGKDGLFDTEFAPAIRQARQGRMGPGPGMKPVTLSEMPGTPHFGPFGWKQMRVENLTDKPITYSGYFSPPLEGDEALKPEDFAKDGKRPWRSMTFDAANDFPSKDPKILVPTPAVKPTNDLVFPPQTKFYWIKRAPGPTASNVKIDGKYLSPDDPNYEVVFKEPGRIIIQPRNP